MIVTGSRSVAAPRELLWQVLSDPARLADALPGVDGVSLDGDSRFSALARPRTALGETRMEMDFEIAEQRPSDYVRISGSGFAGESLISLTIELELADGGAALTQASWRAEVAVRGVLSSLLQRGLGPLFNQQVEEVLEAGARICEGAGGG
jgi:carbon monoxide dehydrogenase subunit G